MPNTTKSMPSFSAAQLESLCKVLADTSSGLTGTEIEHVLIQIGVEDVDPNNTKWKRLYNALGSRQESDRRGNKVFAFIAKALDPARYLGAHPKFEDRRQRTNVTLAFLGFEFGADGKFYTRQAATSLTEAEQRANRLKAALESRKIHRSILEFCRAELVEDNCFHAVLEACKSVASRIRDKTGLDLDGSELAQRAFGGQQPLLKINSCSTETERGEQRGFLNLATGLFGTFRNPTAHAPRIEWVMSEDDALDLFTLASYIHRRIDGATLVRQSNDAPSV